MTQLSSLPWYLYLVPVCVVAATVAVSKLLNISRIVSFVGACAPLALPYSELQIQPQSLFSKPYMQVVGGWGALIACALSWFILRVIVRASRGPLGLLRALFSVLLFAAGAVVVLLIASPELLSAYAPTWRESAGGLLLSVAVIGVGVYFIRLFKTAALLGLCIVSVLVLGSQVAFSKMPYDLGDEECTKIERALPASLPKGVVESGVRRLVKVTSSTRDALRAATSHDIGS
jgi:hypothetical protein